jgi:Amidohydrolase family
VDRETALRLWTESNTWFSAEQGKKGAIKTGQLADLAVLSADFMSAPEAEIAEITSVLTMLGGKVVHGAEEHKDEAPALPPPMPDWSPVRSFGGYQQRRADAATARKFAAACGCVRSCNVHGHAHAAAWAASAPAADAARFWGVMGCSCWAV